MDSTPMPRDEHDDDTSWSLGVRVVIGVLAVLGALSVLRWVAGAVFGLVKLALVVAIVVGLIVVWRALTRRR